MATKQPAKASARVAPTLAPNGRAPSKPPGQSRVEIGPLDIPQINRPRARKKIQAALYEIAATASAVQNMDEFYAAMHRIVGELMYARLLLSRSTMNKPTVPWPYCVDTVDIEPPPSTFLKNHHGRDRLGTCRRMGKTGAEVDGSCRPKGARRGTGMLAQNPKWIAAPLKLEDKTVGVVLVQSYIKGIGYRSKMRILNLSRSTSPRR